MQAGAAQPSVADAVDMVLEFWEAAVHGILAARGLYRPDLFTQERLYGLAVQRARHPDLCSYIAKALHELRAPLLDGMLPCALLTILDPTQAATLEEYALDLEILETGLGTHADVRDMHAVLRSAMLRLQHTTGALAPLHPDSAWRLQAKVVGLVPETSWITVEATQPQPTPALIPVRSVKLPGCLALQLSVRLAPGVTP